MLHIPVGIPLSESCSFSSLFGCPGEAIILAFQHYILALGTAVMIPAVLVPMMGGDDVSSPPALRFLTALCLRVGSCFVMWCFFGASFRLGNGVAARRGTGCGWCRRCCS